MKIGSIDKVNKFIKKYDFINNLIPIIENDVDIYFNCWGFTALLKGWISSHEWLGCNTMDALLIANTRKIKKCSLKAGDIIAFYGENMFSGGNSYELLHTVLYLGNDLILHKNGGCYMRISLLSKNEYVVDSCETHYYRPYVKPRMLWEEL